MKWRQAAAVVVAMVMATGATPSSADPGPGSFSFVADRYSVSLAWSELATEHVVTGSIQAAGRRAAFTYSLFFSHVEVRRGLDPRHPAVVMVRDASVTHEAGVPTLTLQVWTSIKETRGSLALTFFPDRILQRADFQLPSAAAFGFLENDVRLEWDEPFGLWGSATADGRVMFDDGASLDRYGVWQDTHRYGVFVTDPGGPLIGHTRIAQGSNVNYTDQGYFRVGSSGSLARTEFNGYGNVPTIGLSQDLWAVDALSFMPDGSTPGGYADLLANFPGYESLPPPDPGNLETSGQTVIAVVDTGINPYHEDFRNPAYTAHPSTYLSGYPADAEALNLTLDVDYDTARATDDGPVWSAVEQEKLYWIPGTKIVGAYSVGEPPGDTSLRVGDHPRRHVIDDHSHGTGVASVSTGYGHGSCPGCLLVAIEATPAGVEWAARQPWIDVISNSYALLGYLPFGEDAVASRAAFQAGKSVLYASGNGYTEMGMLPDRNLSVTASGSGPSWVITVGAASPRNDNAHSWHGVPVDVISYGSRYPAAAHDSIDGGQVFSGTSSATPITAGVEGALLLAARTMFADVVEGTDTELASLAAGGEAPSSGPLADGTLTRDELEQVVMRTAIPTNFDPNEPIAHNTVPGTPAGYMWEGYGLVNRTSLARGLQVLEGTMALPERPEVDAWIETTDGVRDAYWGEP